MQEAAKTFMKLDFPMPVVAKTPMWWSMASLCRATGMSHQLGAVPQTADLDVPHGLPEKSKLLAFRSGYRGELCGYGAGLLERSIPDTQPSGSAIMRLKICSRSKNCVPLIVVSQFPS